MALFCGSLERSRLGMRGAGGLGPPHGDAPLFGFWESVRGGACRLVCRGVQGWGAGSLGRLDAGAAVPSPAPSRRQRALFGFAGLSSREPGVVGFGSVGVTRPAKRQKALNRLKTAPILRKTDPIGTATLTRCQKSTLTVCRKTSARLGILQFPAPKPPENRAKGRFWPRKAGF